MGVLGDPLAFSSDDVPSNDSARRVSPEALLSREATRCCGCPQPAASRGTAQQRRVGGDRPASDVTAAEESNGAISADR